MRDAILGLKGALAVGVLLAAAAAPGFAQVEDVTSERPPGDGPTRVEVAFYLIDRRTGGAVYNLAHFYLWPVALGAFGILGESLGAQMAALIWGGHVAFDRALGWGLKYETSFCHTDMGVKELAYPVAFLGPQDAE